MEIYQRSPFDFFHCLLSASHGYQVHLFCLLTNDSYATWSIIGFIFNFVIKRRSPAWWAKYNYVTSAGLDSGLAISLIVIFLCLSLPKGGIPFNWWGNVDAFNTAVYPSFAMANMQDYNAVPLIVLSGNETFGPSTW
jgi:hypothetical protein